LIKTIVDGIATGLISTTIMTIWELPFWKIWGIQGILEWHENQILVAKIIKKFKRTENNSTSYIGIFLLHIINGTLAALVFPFVYLFFTSPFFINKFSISIIAGIIYGIFLWILTLLPIHKPITGLSIWDHPLGKGPLIISFCGHMLYGITLGITTNILL
jgi:hypothetical protein